MKHSYNSFKEFFRYIFKKKSVKTELNIKKVAVAASAMILCAFMLFGCGPTINNPSSTSEPVDVTSTEATPTEPVTSPDSSEPVTSDSEPSTTTNNNDILSGYDKIPDTKPPVVDIPTTTPGGSSNPDDSASTPDVTIDAGTAIDKDGNLSVGFKAALDHFGPTNASGSHFIAFYPETTNDGGLSICRIVSGAGKGTQTDYLYYENASDYEKVKANYPAESCIDEIRTIIVSTGETSEVKNPATVPCVLFYGYIIYR